MRSLPNIGRLVLVAFGLLVLPAPAHAAPAGSLDPGYGSGGTLRLPAPSPDLVGLAALDGRILAVGGARGYSNLLVRVLDGKGRLLRGAGTDTPLGRSGSHGDGVEAAVVDPASDRVMVLANLQSRSGYSEELIALTANGAPDPAFGTDGRTLLPGDSSGGLAVAPDGTIIVASEMNTSTGTVLGVQRVSTTGTLLSSLTFPSIPEPDQPVPVALSDGSALVAVNRTGSDSASAELVHVTAAGTWDTAFGGSGTVSLGDDVGIDAATLGPDGNVILAGSHLADDGQSGLTAASPLLMQIATDGTIDQGFGYVGRGILTGEGGAIVALAVDGDRIFGLQGSGGLIDVSESGGVLDPGFGIGGGSPATPGLDGREAGGFTILGDRALVGASGPKALVFDEVRLAGSGVLAPRSGARVTVARTSGHVTVTMPLSQIAQPLTTPLAAPLDVGHVNAGEDGIYDPPGVILDARRGAITVRGVGGDAVLRGGRATLHRLHGVVATLVFAAGRRGGGSCAPATLVVHGRFGVRVGRGATIVPRSPGRIGVRPCAALRR